MTTPFSTIGKNVVSLCQYAVQLLLSLPGIAIFIDCTPTTMRQQLLGIDLLCYPARGHATEDGYCRVNYN